VSPRPWVTDGAGRGDAWRSGPMRGGQHAEEEAVVDGVTRKEDEYIDGVVRRKKLSRAEEEVVESHDPPIMRRVTR
jgi:hypothetical protein